VHVVLLDLLEESKEEHLSGAVLCLSIAQDAATVIVQRTEDSSKLVKVILALQRAPYYCSLRGLATFVNRN
jgi:hypothetical protein